VTFLPKVVERFLRYVEFDTKSDPDSETVPSSKKQLLLAEELVKELQELGLEEVSLDQYGYVYATLPANAPHLPAIGFIAHMDTSPDMSGANVKPRIITSYNGEDIILNQEHNIIMKVKDFPEILAYLGKDLIVTDGTTLLGADDKAGIAEIITAIEYLLHSPQIKHGTIKIAFTPDEEIGRGADHFDVKGFNCDFAYTVDGGPIGELEYENFNAAGVIVNINGRNVHPGTAKGKMFNSMLIANQFISALPTNETPETTDGYEGFFHLTDITGEVERTVLKYIIRDFNQESFQKRKEKMLEIANILNSQYGDTTVVVAIKDQYYNMKEKIEPVMHIVDTAFQAMELAEVKPLVKPIRGGTDGARLSFMGLPTPNLFTGGHNFHGKYEFIPTFAMEKAVEVIVNIIKLYGNNHTN